MLDFTRFSHEHLRNDVFEANDDNERKVTLQDELVSVRPYTVR